MSNRGVCLIAQYECNQIANVHQLLYSQWCCRWRLESPFKFNPPVHILTTSTELILFQYLGSLWENGQFQLQLQLCVTRMSFLMSYWTKAVVLFTFCWTEPLGFDCLESLNLFQFSCFSFDTSGFFFSKVDFTQKSAESYLISFLLELKNFMYNPKKSLF